LLMVKETLSETFCSAHLWLVKGFKVYPVQPNTKYMMAGYGPHAKSLQDADAIEFWFRYRSSNIAVSTPSNAIILDFDDIEVYNQFEEQSPEAASSYTEGTPRGGAHVFLYIDDELPKFKPVYGLEVKQCCLVYPSVVQGKVYQPLNSQKIITVNGQEALDGFVVWDEPVKPVNSLKVAPGVDFRANWGILAEVKKKWSFLEYLALYEPDLRLMLRGRWMTGLCPFHSDTHPSLWVDTEKNLFGCHACGAHGDLVNWVAMRGGFESQASAARYLNNLKAGG
jgi:hypothetical protein